MKIKGRLINAYYKSTFTDFTLYFVVLTFVDDKLQKITIPWQPDITPYFYCTGESIEFLTKCFEKIKCGYDFSPDPSVRLFDNDSLPYKVETLTPDKIGSIKGLSMWKNNLHYNNNCMFEGDTTYVLRYLIDKGLGVELEFDFDNHTIRNCPLGPEYDPRILYIDLEVIDDTIVSMAYGDSLANISFCRRSEEFIFDLIQELMNDYDYFVTWTNYEETILKKQANTLNLVIDWHQICFIDQAFVTMATVRKFTGRSFLALDEFGDRTTGLRKIKMSKGLDWYYEHKPKRFERYNKRDVEIQIAGEEATGAVAGWIEAVNYADIPLQYAQYVSILTKILILRKLYNLPKRIVLPNGKKGVKIDKYKGAIVTQDPPHGVFDNVFAVDLLGSYVGIIRTYFPHLKNLIDISDTVAEVMAMIPHIIDQTTDMRNASKEQRDTFHKGSYFYNKFNSKQYGMKVVSLLFYGELGRGGSPVYVQKCAEFITDMGREHIERAEEVLERDFPVKRLYKDTDSIYWQFLFDMVWTKESVQNMINQVTYEINLDFHFMLDMKGIPDKDRYVKMDGQAFYNRILWAGIAKNYMGYEQYSCDTKEWHDVPKLFIKGWVKLGSGKLALDVQHLVGRLLLDGVDLKTIIGYLRCIKDDIFRGRYNKGLIQKTGLSKPLDEYKSRTFVWYAAKRAQDAGLYKERTEFQWVVTYASKKQVHADMVCQGVIPKIFKSGYKHMWKRYVLSKAIAPLKAVEQNENIIKSMVQIVPEVMDIFFGEK